MDDGATESEDVKATAQIGVASAERQSVSRELVAYGIIEPSDQGTSAVSLSYDCVVRTVATTLGSRVSRGTPLVVVEPSPDARLQLDSARNIASLAARSFSSSRQRFELRLGTEDDLRAAEQAAEDSRLKVESLERRGLGDGDRTLAAPSDGIVVRLDAVPGTIVPAGTVIAAVARLDSLRARIGIEASDATHIRTGQKVTLVSLSRLGVPPANGKVGIVSVVADPGTGSLDVWVPLSSGEGWFPGERVEAHIELERKLALVVPAAAMLPDGGKEVVYTVKGGKAVRHLVQAGIRSGDVVEIIGSDISAGDAVVVQGNYELSDGMDVSLPGKATGAPDPSGDKR
jgi:RND family efflux transporter MFP subunit